MRRNNPEFTTRPHRHAPIQFVVLLLLASSGLLITGCDKGAAALVASDDLRAPVARDGGLEVTVPALWADSKNAQSGTEPARIWATRDGASTFTIDLNDIRAQGAGDQWTAASAAAAAVGSMISGLNPATIDVDFAVSGPIDGPSAGAILTVGVLSALLDAPLRGDTTMTGTISPDGSIGPIGGADLKLKAAAEQGYARVLLPLANMSLRDSASGAVISAIDAGRRLGLEVVGVGNVQEAFTLFTDGAFAYTESAPFQLPNAVAAATRRQTTDLISLLNDKVLNSPSMTKTSQSSILLQEATSSFRRGDFAAAYGVASTGLYSEGRERAQSRMRALFAAKGAAAASKRLLADLTMQRSLISDRLASLTGGTSSLGYEQLISLPNVLSWLTYDEAILEALDARLSPSALDAGTAERFARIISDVQVDLDVLEPNQAQILRLSPTLPNPGGLTVATYLSQYTAFLIRSGQAQLDYVEKVLLRGQDPRKVAALNDVGMLLPVVLKLSDSAAAIPATVGSLRDEEIESSTALTFYIATTSLISALQGLGLTEFGIGSDPSSSKSPIVLDRAVTTSALAVRHVSSSLAQRGLDASLASWAASTAADGAQAMAGSSQETAFDVRALNELYFDAINVFMLQSGPIG